MLNLVSAQYMLGSIPPAQVDMHANERTMAGNTEWNGKWAACYDSKPHLRPSRHGMGKPLNTGSNAATANRFQSNA